MLYGRPEEGGVTKTRSLLACEELGKSFFTSVQQRKCKKIDRYVKESKGGTLQSVATPLWPSVGVKPNTWKSWELESSGTPECSEVDSKGQNTSHWGVPGVIGKVLKRRYRKCPRIGNSDICSPSYGQKKGRESNWQFDSRPLKVGNRPLPDVRFGSATWRWKDLDEGYNFDSDLVAIQLCSRELSRFKVPGVPPGQFRDSISGVPGICAIWMWSPQRALENTIGE
jgi:hypothetical protein